MQLARALLQLARGRRQRTRLEPGQALAQRGEALRGVAPSQHRAGVAHARVARQLST